MFSTSNTSMLQYLKITLKHLATLFVKEIKTNFDILSIFTSRLAHHSNTVIVILCDVKLQLNFRHLSLQLAAVLLAAAVAMIPVGQAALESLLALA